MATTSTSTTSKSSTSTTESSVDKMLAEYVPPAGSAEEVKLTAADFKTSDDAQIAFLEERIDEDVFAQVVNKYGKPSNRSEVSRDRLDRSYERDLPKWAFDPPEGAGLTVKEQIAALEAEQKEAEEAAKEETDTSSTTPPGSSTSSSSTSSS